MPWYGLVLLAVGATCVGVTGGLLLWRLDHPRRRLGVSARLAARLGGQCGICHQVGHTSREHVRLPNSLLQGRHKGDWGRWGNGCG